ncbi:MAG TPA: VOC family protein [Anaeromyxobacteraceae bacterium]|nr:VOC family protein [Anaeromyxobacteraceae bacterium]
MLDHITLRVRDVAAAKSFYAAALKPLGYAVVMEFPDGAGLGVEGKPDFWLAADAGASPQHVAFAALDRRAVDAFHAAALKAGGTDNGAPGLRPDYHPNYYAAFVLDPSGHNMEAVCHAPAGARKRAAPKAPARKAARPKASAKAKPAKRGARAKRRR